MPEVRVETNEAPKLLNTISFNKELKYEPKKIIFMRTKKLLYT